MKQKLMGIFYKYSPNWIFAITYNLLLSKKTGTVIKKISDGWLIYGVNNGDFALKSFTPKMLNVHYKHFIEKFDRNPFVKICVGDTCLDVGACIGDTTIPIAQRAGNTGKVIAIEADPLNGKWLEKNMQSFPGIKIIIKGAWSSKGKLDLHTHSAITGHSLDAREDCKGIRTIEVDTIDNMIGNSQIHFAKIDVQGSEIEVLKSADILLRTCPKLIVETHDRYNPGKRTYPGVIEVLKKYGYRYEYCDENGCVYAWRDSGTK